MFEKISRLAETAANNASVSRRGFLGQLGRGALTAAGVVGGLLFSARDAHAGDGVVCCYYQCRGNKPYTYDFKTTCQKAGTTCDAWVNGYKCSLYASSTAAKCNDC